jgi:hypothetical protein
VSAQPSVEQAVGRALDAYAALTLLAEEVADEWQYVTDLSAAWRATLETIATERKGQLIRPERAAAIEAAADEIGLVADPHRAIDWLSTFPQVVLLAVLAP